MDYINIVICSLNLLPFVAMAWWNPVSLNDLPISIPEEPEDHGEAKLIYLQAIKVMRNKRLYLRKNIRITELADRLNERHKIVSHAINHHGGGNFNTFVNEFRIEHSKQLIISGRLDRFTIGAIADESGFSNKVSFNQAFKSNTGMSPSEFRSAYG